MKNILFIFLLRIFIRYKYNNIFNYLLNNHILVELIKLAYLQYYILLQSNLTIKIHYIQTFK